MDDLEAPSSGVNVFAQFRARSTGRAYYIPFAGTASSVEQAEFWNAHPALTRVAQRLDGTKAAVTTQPSHSSFAPGFVAVNAPSSSSASSASLNWIPTVSSSTPASSSRGSNNAADREVTAWLEQRGAAARQKRNAAAAK